VSLERSRSVDIENGLALVIWTSAAQVMGKRKVGNRPVPDVRFGSARWRWKALFEGYNFGSDLVPIGGRGEELCSSKVLGLQPGTISGLHFGSPGTKSHSDAPSTE
jgi:hypothetical protein